MKNLAIIPARSGSKGLKNKNILDLNGKPLMAWTIEAAVQSGEFDEVMVSTDSEEYAKIGIRYGAHAPFIRSTETATDKASSWDVVAEVLNGYRKLGKLFDTFCLLQPTSPLRNAEDIREAYTLYRDRTDFAVVSVCEAEHSPLWCGHLPDNLELLDFINEEAMQQRQAGEKYYRLNGAIYIVNSRKFFKDRFLYKKGSFAYVMPQERSVDIDTEMDFKFASLLLRETQS